MNTIDTPLLIGLAGLLIVAIATLLLRSSTLPDLGGPGRWDEEGQWQPDPMVRRQLDGVWKMARMSLGGSALIAAALACSLSS